MPSKLDQLRAMTVVVSDTGDIDAVRRLKPQDCTTNPSLVLKAVSTPAGKEILAEAVRWADGLNGSLEARTIAACDRVAVAIGTELTRIVPGRVSTEVDADLSFNVKGSIEKAQSVISMTHPGPGCELSKASRFMCKPPHVSPRKRFSCFLG